MYINGSCHCGAIRYTAEVDPADTLVCHCTDCQAFSGGAFRAVVFAKAAQVRLTGEPKTYVKMADSGRKRAQVFCPDCGTHLYATSVDDPAIYGIRLGTVAQRNELPPQKQIWHHSAVAWLDLVQGLPELPVK
jgi:hypothetical protein